MSRSHDPPERPAHRFDIDHATNNAPPPPSTPKNPQQCGPSYLWNGTWQRLIKVLPEYHPDYEENAKMITETIRRWNEGKP